MSNQVDNTDQIGIDEMHEMLRRIEKCGHKKNQNRDVWLAAASDIKEIFDQVLDIIAMRNNNKDND